MCQKRWKQSSRPLLRHDNPASASPGRPMQRAPAAIRNTRLPAALLPLLQKAPSPHVRGSLWRRSSRWCSSCHCVLRFHSPPRSSSVLCSRSLCRFCSWWRPLLYRQFLKMVNPHKRCARLQRFRRNGNALTGCRACTGQESPI